MPAATPPCPPPRRGAAHPPPLPSLRRVAAVAVAGSALLLAACAPEAPPAEGAAGPAPAVVETAPAEAGPAAVLPAGDVEAVALEIGSRLDADGRVAQVQERFRPADTVQASLVTVGSAPAAMLEIEWRSADGRVLAADQRAIAPAGPAVHSFSRSVEGGWPPGQYAVEVRLDGESAGIRAFEVR